MLNSERGNSDEDGGFAAHFTRNNKHKFTNFQFSQTQIEEKISDTVPKKDAINVYEVRGYVTSALSENESESETKVNNLHSSRSESESCLRMS